MRARFFTTVILLFTLCSLLCCCGNPFEAPLDKFEVPIHVNVETIRIYICGAVEHEGYYDVEMGTDYVQVLRLAGILPESVMPTLSSSYVDGKLTMIIVGYYDGEATHDSINANNPMIAARMPVDGLSADVIDKLADYIEVHGKITNKNQLLEALGDDYADNFYKLFIAEKDYEETD
ncbi:MAG: hypothetical protein J1F68_04245 [Clostridiales bacterium]|nr:hypothetical protein [Clostridiales bacterium]